MGKSVLSFPLAWCVVTSAVFFRAWGVCLISVDVDGLSSVIFIAVAACAVDERGLGCAYVFQA